MIEECNVRLPDNNDFVNCGKEAVVTFTRVNTAMQKYNRCKYHAELEIRTLWLYVDQIEKVQDTLRMIGQ